MSWKLQEIKWHTIKGMFLFIYSTIKFPGCPITIWPFGGAFIHVFIFLQTLAASFCPSSSSSSSASASWFAIFIAVSRTPMKFCWLPSEPWSGGQPRKETHVNKLINSNNWSTSLKYNIHNFTRWHRKIGQADRSARSMSSDGILILLLIHIKRKSY